MNKRRPLLLLPVFVCFLAMNFSRQALDRHRTPERALEEDLHLPDGKVLRVLSLGFNTLLGDLLWIKSVTYFGKRTLDEDNPFYHVLRQKRGLAAEDEHEGHHDHEHAEHAYNGVPLAGKTPGRQNEPARSDSDRLNLSPDRQLHSVLFDFQSQDMAPYIYPLLRRVVELDPHFIYPYEFGGLVVLMDTGEIEEACSLLEFGWQHNPKRWEFPYYLGFIELFYRGNNRRALELLSQALVLPGRPDFLEALYISFLQKSNASVIMLGYLRGLYASSQDADFRKHILQLIQKICQTSS